MENIKFLRVFCDILGGHGDIQPLVVDELHRISNPERKEMAAKMLDQYGAAETVFINDIEQRLISILHRDGELDFAGVPALGAAWYLGQELEGSFTLQMKNSESRCLIDDGVVWIDCGESSLPPWNLREYNTADQVEHLTAAEISSLDHTVAWAWVDQPRGLIRARTFAADWGIDEAEANGSGAMLLAKKVDKTIQIKHGIGSEIYVRLSDEGVLSLGGRVITAEAKY